MAWHEYCDMDEEERFEPDGDTSEELINTKVIHKTDKAVLIQHIGRQAWFPKAVIYTLEEDCMSYKYTFSPAWKILKKRLPTIEGDYV